MSKIPDKRVYRANRPLFSLPETHPARRFLNAFMQVLEDCVGKEVPYEGYEHLAVDQEWFSATDLRTWKSSSFAYAYLSFTVELDGWLVNAAAPTDGERNVIERLPYLRLLVNECKEACIGEGNERVLVMALQVERLFDLWEACIRERWRAIGYSAQPSSSSSA